MPDNVQSQREVPFEESPPSDEIRPAREELASEEEGGMEDIAMEAEIAEEEEIYANQLALQQEQDQELQTIDALQEEARSFSGPSLFKYLIILLMFAIPNDLIDALDLTGIGFFISWLISFFLSVSTILITWFSDSELKRVKEHMAKKASYQKILSKKGTRFAARLIKFAPRSPVVKAIAGAILELIPLVSILPWSTISVGLAYLDERNMHKQAREGSSDLLPSYQEA